MTESKGRCVELGTQPSAGRQERKNFASVMKRNDAKITSENPWHSCRRLSGISASIPNPRRRWAILDHLTPCYIFPLIFGGAAREAGISYVVLAGARESPDIFGRRRAPPSESQEGSMVRRRGARLDFTLIRFD